MNPVYRPGALVAAIALSLAGPATAQQAPTLDTVQVTATRVQRPLDDTPASVTVITREQIEASQSPDLLDLLGRQAGIDLSRTGGPGQSSTLFLRGANSNHTLVLVDGVRVNSASQGVFDFAHLPLSQVERIEIVRGPRAALWGSDAIGGVVQVFSRDPAGTSAAIRAGSYGRRGGEASFGGGGDRGRLGVSLGLDRLDGFSATNPGAFGHDPDDDGYRNRSLSLRGRTTLGTQSLSASALQTDADVEFDQGRTDARNGEYALRLAGPLGAGWQQSLALGHAREDLDTPAFGIAIENRRDSLDWVLARGLGEAGELNLGLNWSDESARSFDFDGSRRNAAAFATWAGRFGAQSLELSLRHDDNSQFGGATTGNVAWGWRAGEDLRGWASWGQGFRAPNFNELYYPGFGGLFAGNPALAPERSNSVEAGLEWRPAPGQRLAAVAYRTRVRSLIAFAGPLFQAININRAALDGVELDYGLDHGPWSLALNATWQDARDLGTGQALLRRAPRKLSASLDRRFDSGLQLGLDAQGVSSRRDFGGDLPGYARFDLRASAPLGRGWRLEARIENLGDRFYELADGYNTPGRSGLLKLVWNAQD